MNLQWLWLHAWDMHKINSSMTSRVSWLPIPAMRTMDYISETISKSQLKLSFVRVSVVMTSLCKNRALTKTTSYSEQEMSSPLEAILTEAYRVDSSLCPPPFVYWLNCTAFVWWLLAKLFSSRTALALHLHCLIIKQLLRCCVIISWMDQ